MTLRQHKGGIHNIFLGGGLKGRLHNMTFLSDLRLAYKGKVMTKDTKKIGAPCKLTPEVHQVIVQAVRKGLPWCHAAAIANIGERTLLNWRTEGEKETDGIYFQLMRDVKKAQAQWVEDRLSRIDAAADSGNWVASAWQLERRDPDHFSLRNKHEIVSEKGGPLEIKVTFDD